MCKFFREKNDVAVSLLLGMVGGIFISYQIGYFNNSDDLILCFAIATGVFIGFKSARSQDHQHENKDYSKVLRI